LCVFGVIARNKKTKAYYVKKRFHTLRYFN